MATKPTYLVTDKSPLHYAGKVAACGTTADDIPGESIGWLTRDGFIIFSPAMVTASELATTPTTSATENSGSSDEGN